MKVLKLMILFLCWPFARSMAQNFTKDDLTKENKLIAELNKQISKIKSDTMLLFKNAQTSQKNFSGQINALNQARTAFIALSAKNSKINLSIPNINLAKITKTNDSLNSVYTKLVEEKKKAVQRNGSLTDSKELAIIAKKMPQLETETNKLYKELSVNSDSAKMYKDKVLNAKAVQKENSEMIKLIIREYDDYAKIISGSDDYNSGGLMALRQQKQKMASLGIDTGKLYSLDNYFQYCILLKSGNDLLKDPYDNKKTAALMQDIRELKSKKTLKAAQKDKIDEYYQLLDNYCALTTKCYEEVTKSNAATGVPVVQETKALKTINDLLAAKQIGYYTFLVKELNRLKLKYNKYDGFKDSKIGKCTN